MTMSTLDPVKVCILTVSDRCSRGEAVDTSGPMLADLVTQDAELRGVVGKTAIVPDTETDIRRQLVTWADSGQADIILTTGGTGFASRDVTPEATLSVLDRQAPGLVTAMLSGSLAVTPLAALSRPAAGIRGHTVIVNMPGSKKAVKECYAFIQPCLRHAVDLLQNRAKPVASTHAELQGGGAAPVHVCPHQTGLDSGDGTVAGRARVSTWPMISVKEAQDIVFTEAGRMMRIAAETVDYRDCVGRTLCEVVVPSTNNRNIIDIFRMWWPWIHCPPFLPASKMATLCWPVMVPG